MAWVSTGGTIVDGEVSGLDTYKVVTSTGAYYETRTNPSDEEQTQVRAHTVITSEFRGLTLAHAQELDGAYVSGLKTVTRTATPLGGGGYVLTQTSDEMPSASWTTLS